jgi:WD40 repeat protein
MAGAAPATGADTATPKWAVDLAGSETFISYSRSDRAFVRRLHEALTGHGLSVWVDFEDIPPTAEWLAELYSGVERAASFIFVISPDSLASEMCQVEVLHALKHGKRVVPVLRRPATVAPPLEAIGKPQWIDAQDDDEFDLALATVLNALGTDPEWLEAHTRLVIRATQWKAAGGGRSGLLHGPELRWAEEWLERGAELGQPTVTDEQRDLVRASRRAARARRRAGLGAAAVVAAGVAVAVLVVTGAQRRAAEERRVSESIRLAESSVAQLPRDPELGRLLAIAAFDRSETPQATAALRRAERAPFASAVYGRHSESVQDLAVNGAGTLAATGAYDDTVRLWDLRPERSHRAALGRQDYAGELLGGHIENVDGVAFSADGRMLASAASSVIKVWDVAERRRAATLRGGDSFGWKTVSFSPDAARVAAIGQRGFKGDEVVAIWNRTGGRPVRHLPVGRDALLTDVAFSPGGSLLATGGLGDPVRLWSLRSGRTVRRIDPGAGVADLDFSSDGRRLAVAAGEVVKIYDVDSRRPRATLRGHDLFVNSASFSRDGRLLVAGSNDDTARVWDVRRRRVVAVLPGGGNVNAARFVPGTGLVVATAGDDGRVRLWQLAPPPRAVLRPGPSGAAQLAYSPDGKRLAGGLGDGSVLVWGPGGEERLVLPDRGEAVFSLGFARDGTRMVTGDAAGTVRVWDLGRRRAPAEFSAGRGPVWKALFMPGQPGRVLTAMNRRPEVAAPATLWNWRDGGAVRAFGRLNGQTETALSVDADPAGSSVVTADGGTVRPILWDAQTGRGRELWGHDGPVHMVAFSSRGDRLLTGSSDDTVRLWNARTRRTLREIDAGTVAGLAFGARDRLILAHTTSTIRVVSADNGATVAELRRPGEQLWHAVLRPDGRQVAATGSDLVVRVYDCPGCVDRAGEALRARVRAQVGRDLREAEEERYLREAAG